MLCFCDYRDSLWHSLNRTNTNMRIPLTIISIILCLLCSSCSEKKILLTGEYDCSTQVVSFIKGPLAGHQYGSLTEATTALKDKGYNASTADDLSIILETSCKKPVKSSLNQNSKILENIVISLEGEGEGAPSPSPQGGIGGRRGIPWPRRAPRRPVVLTEVTMKGTQGRLFSQAETKVVSNGKPLAEFVKNAGCSLISFRPPQCVYPNGDVKGISPK